MSLVDPISDMLTRIRNAYAVDKTSVAVSSSNLKEAVLGILKSSGYIEGFKKNGSDIDIDLKYDDSKPVIEKIERISRPGRRVYVKRDEIPAVLSGRGILIISTSKGMMTGEQAKNENLGGEIICRVY